MENKKVRASLSRLFDVMGRGQILVSDVSGHHPVMVKLDRILDYGVTKLTWTSLGIDEYVTDCRLLLSQLQLITSKAEDLIEHRIQAILSDIEDLVLCELPTGEPWTLEQFLENTRVSSSKLSYKCSMCL